MTFCKHILLVSSFFLSVIILNAQNKTGALIGKVKDAYNDNAIKNATVTLLGNNKLFQAISNKKGIYEFSQLPVGVYTVIVSKDNFKINELTDYISVSEDSIATVTFKLIPLFKLIKSANIFSNNFIVEDTNVPYWVRGGKSYSIINWVKQPETTLIYFDNYKRIIPTMQFDNDEISNSEYLNRIRIASDYFIIKTK